MVCIWLGLRSAVYILQVGKVVGRSPRPDRAIQRSGNSSSLGDVVLPVVARERSPKT